MALRILASYGSEYKAGRLVAGTILGVVQTGVVFTLQLRPRKQVTHGHPEVRLVYPLEGRAEQIEAQLLVM